MPFFKNPLLLSCHSRMSPRLSSPAPAGPRRAPRAELRRHPPVSPGLRPRVHGLPGHGRVFSALVRRHSPGTDGVSDQEAASRGGDAMREGTHLPAGEVRGQDPQEALLGKAGGRNQNVGLEIEVSRETKS